MYSFQPSASLLSSDLTLTPLTWLDLVLGFERLPLDVTQVLGSRAREALVSQTHVLLPDGQGAVQTLAGQLEVIHGHLKKQT